MVLAVVDGMVVAVYFDDDLSIMVAVYFDDDLLIMVVAVVDFVEYCQL